MFQLAGLDSQLGGLLHVIVLPTPIEVDGTDQLGSEVGDPARIVNLVVEIRHIGVETALSDDVRERQGGVIGVVITDPRRELRIEAGSNLGHARLGLANAGRGRGQVWILGEGQVNRLIEADTVQGVLLWYDGDFPGRNDLGEEQQAQAKQKAPGGVKPVGHSWNSLIDFECIPISGGVLLGNYYMTKSSMNETQAKLFRR